MHELLGHRIDAALSNHRTPLAIVDVDLTLVDNAPRTRAIFSDWLHSVRDRWPPAADRAIDALTMPIVFAVKDNLRYLGVTDPDLQQDALRFWWKAFFSNEYCIRDVALPGAVDGIEALRERGVTIAYLTARTANMAGGTVATFQRLGFPVATPGTVLVMKPDPSEPDRAYKQRSIHWLTQLGEIVVCADNEPSHANAMHAACPEALTLLVGNRHSSPAPEAAPGVIKVARFSEMIVEEPS